MQISLLQHKTKRIIVGLAPPGSQVCCSFTTRSC